MEARHISLTACIWFHIKRRPYTRLGFVRANVTSRAPCPISLLILQACEAISITALGSNFSLIREHLNKRSLGLSARACTRKRGRESVLCIFLWTSVYHRLPSCPSNGPFYHLAYNFSSVIFRRLQKLCHVNVLKSALCHCVLPYIPLFNEQFILAKREQNELRGACETASVCLRSSLVSVSNWFRLRYSYY